MLIVVSSPTKIESESAVINSLFAAGLTLFHLRKPNTQLEEIRQLLEDIEKKYLSRIVLHQEHQLGLEFGINRLHFKEVDRLKLKESDFEKMKNSGMIYSTSVHSKEDYFQLNGVFNYAFYGPVFESISKPGYKPEKEVDFKFKNEKTTKLIGIGGITINNYRQVFEKGFDGIALCGTIWEAENQLTTFESINNECQKIGLTY
ncbi:MAG: thiamine phosphate synthase [Flavobacteriia bacterium]|nr:thiamine phosphate synthase [Flavobacteriia bacterium]